MCFHGLKKRKQYSFKYSAIKHEKKGKNYEGEKEEKNQEEKELSIGLQLHKKLQEKIIKPNSDVHRVSCPLPSF